MQDIENFISGKTTRDPTTKRLRKQIAEQEPSQMLAFLLENAEFFTQHYKTAIHFLEVLEACFLESKTYSESEEIVRMFVKLLSELAGKRECANGSLKFELKRCVKILLANSAIFVKFIKAVLKKFDWKVLNNIAIILCDIDNQEIREVVEQRVKDELLKLESQPVHIKAPLLGLCSSSFLEENLVNFSRKIMKKSVGNLTKVAELLRPLENEDLSNYKSLDKLEELLENYLMDSFSKGDEFIENVFTIARVILSKRSNYSNKEKVQNFISSVNKKLYKNQNERMNWMFCKLVSSININFDDKLVSDTVVQFFDSFNSAKTVSAINELIRSVENEPSWHSDIVAKTIIEKNKFNDQPLLAYAILKKFENKQESSVGIFESYKAALQENWNKNSAKKITLSNFQNLIYFASIKLSEQNSNNDLSTEVFKMLMSKDNIFTKSTFFESLTANDSEVLWRIICNIKDDKLSRLKKDEIERKNFGMFMVGALNKLKKSSRIESFDISKFKLKIVIEGLFLVVKGSDQSKVEEERYKFVFGFILCQPKFTFNLKNKSIVGKIVYLLSNPSITDKNLLEKISQQNAFQTFSNFTESFPQNISHLFSKQNLLSSNEADVELATQALSTHIYFYPSIFAEITKFYDKNVLVLLTRLKRLTQTISQLKKFDFNSLMEKSDNDIISQAVGNSAQETVKKQSGKDTAAKEVKLFETLDQLASREPDEEERFEELASLNYKAEILEDYQRILKAISHVIVDFFERFGKTLRPEHTNALKTSLKTLKSSLRSAKYLRNSLKEVFVLALKNLTNEGSDMIEQLASFYFQIISGEESAAFVRRYEYFVKKVDLETFKTTKEFFGMLFESLVFSFRSKIDPEYQRKLFKHIHQILPDFPKKRLDFFNFICDHLNELYFDEAFEAFEQNLKALLPTETTVLDKSLQHVLDYEDFALKMTLKKVISLASQNPIGNQHVQALQQLKLLILTDSENQEVTDLANNLINVDPIFKFGASSFESLDFEQMLLEFPFDMQETIVKIFLGVFESLESDQKTKFLDKLISENKNLIGKIEISSDDSDQLETKLKLFPLIIRALMDKMQIKHFATFFEYIYGLLNRR